MLFRSVLTIPKSELPEANQTNVYSVSLAGMEGLIRTGIYVRSTTGRASSAQIRSIEYEATCPTDIEAEVNDITTESATISWTSESDECLYFVRESGSTAKDYIVTTEKSVELTDLSPRTVYEVGITKMCAIDDTARVVIVKFTTQSLAPCLLPENVSAQTSAYAASLNWEGDAMTYMFRYREYGSDEWSTRSVETNQIRLEGLNPQTTYEYELQSVCSEAEGDRSEWSETAQFVTPEVTCFTPDNIRIEPTHNSALIEWDGNAEHYELNLRKGNGEWEIRMIESNTVSIDDLEAETTYSIRLRSICSDTETSLWSSILEFRTTAVPECITPVNLQTSMLDYNTVRLQWDADDLHISWDVRYRAGHITSWTSVPALNETTCDVHELLENTTYLWSVKASCDEGRTSAWATQDQFQTLVDGLIGTSANELNVYLDGSILNVINGSHAWIERIALYNLNGQIIRSFEVNSDENVFIPLKLSENRFIIRIEGKGWNKAIHLNQR